jgi:hypothetical protein
LALYCIHVGQAIVYCFKCQRRVLGQEFEKGAAFQIGNHVTCVACATHLLETLSGKDKESLLAQMFKSSQENQKVSSGSGSRIPAPPSSTHPRAHKSGHIPVLRPPAGPSTPAIVAGAVAGIVLLIVVVAVVAGGSKPVLPAPQPPTRTPAPAATPDAGRRESAQAALQKARQFARDNPRDFPGQLRAWEAAVNAAERTPLFEEARRELGGLTVRRKEAVAAELADLEGRVRALVGAEDFKSAEILLEEARARREGSDWLPAVDALTRSVREAVAKLFASLKAKAVDVPSRQALRERILKWGLPEFSIDPEPPAPAPAPVENRPWRSLIAKGLDSLRGRGHGGWRVENGALIKTDRDDAAQVNEEIGDGEIRVRFEIVNAYRVRFTLRQGGPGDGFDAVQDVEKMTAGPHEAVFLCKGDTITGTFDGRPFPVVPGKARSGLLQFNTAPPTSVLRILSLEIRPLQP